MLPVPGSPPMPGGCREPTIQVVAGVAKPDVAQAADVTAAGVAGPLPMPARPPPDRIPEPEVGIAIL